MTQVLCVRLIWEPRGALPMPRIPGVRLHDITVRPETDHPAGRKGRVLAAAWEQLGAAQHAGMLILDGDVAADPHDYAQMLAAIGADPVSVWTAPVRTWPASTTRGAWTWGHWRGAPSQEDCPDPFYFTFCFTFLPRAVLKYSIAAGLRRWRFPAVDTRVAGVAAAAGVPVRVCYGAQPKHMHY